MQARTIPNIRLETTRTGKSTTRLIKGFIQLPCWTGYFLAEKPNYLFKTQVVTDGKIELWVDGEIKDNGSFAVDAEQINAYYFLVEHQQRIKQKILDELKRKLPELLSTEYAAWDHEEGGFPKLTELTPEFDFRNYIGPGSVSIEEDKKEDIAYLKWHFQCLWDPEHGFEVITHKDKVIDLGPEADIFKINQDNGTFEALESELTNKQWKVPAKKKWWKFW